MYKCLVYDLFSYIIFFAMLHAGDTVRIQELRVPSLVRHGTGVILDCDYTLNDGDHDGIVVKWFLNDDTRPVYQWIAGDKGHVPQSLGILRNRLNLSYRASTDSKTWHRALHIPEPVADMSGEYTCVVSTYLGEDRQSKNMLVFVPERSLRLQEKKSSDDVGVLCTAEGVFPQPEMSIRATYGNVTDELDGYPVLNRQPDGLYDITLQASLPEDARNVPLDLACELNIPTANYTVHKQLVYYPGNANIHKSSYAWMILTVFAIVKYLLRL